MEALKSAALRSRLRWLQHNADLMVALSLAILFSVLGALGVVGEQLLFNVVLATLAVIAFTLVRDREAREAALLAMGASLDRRLSALDGSVSQLTQSIQLLDRSVSHVGEAIRLMDTLIKPTPGHFLSDDFKQAIFDTTLWIYKGGTGTYLRAATLPGNANNALRAKRPRHISIEILDPTNLELCERYGQFRRAVDPQPDKTGETWTTRRVRTEAYATILAAAWYRERYGLLDIQLGLAAVMSLFRYDLSSRYIIITQEDGTAPALKANAGTYFYDSYLNELKLSFDQTRKIDLRPAHGIPLGEGEIAGAEVGGLFEALGVPLDASFEQRDVEAIIQKAMRPVNLYG